MTTTDFTGPNRRWFLALGIALLVIGFLAILFPLVFTLTAQILVGMAMLVGGIAVLVHAFGERSWSGLLWEILVGALYVIAGLYFIFDPLGGMIAFTIALAAFFIVDGVFRIIMGVKARPHSGAIWAIIGGVLSILLGILIWSGLPGSATWAVGTLVGINLAFAGAAFVAMGTSAFAPK
ncbi:HdeD family acid-resistance protein [Rhodoligotrophos defluvii]|uniref:HdeD family acid-resistance protein n=1 Tax=Rhodoligotrophos defluvii TaxID=2561934 RepID=UPI0014854AFF|nr:HdeD family acid-resistance protein [Rhodoligotrophos defluvii]